MEAEQRSIGGHHQFNRWLEGLEKGTISGVKLSCAPPIDLLDAPLIDIVCGWRLWVEQQSIRIAHDAAAFKHAQPSYNLMRLWSGRRDVTQVNYLVNAEGSNVGQHGFQCNKVAVNVSD
jgi:hypothetical protein